MPNYDLPQTEMRQRAEAALFGYPDGGPFIALAVRHDDLMADVARSVERKVFEESFALDGSVMAETRISSALR